MDSDKIFINGEWYILCSSVPLTTKKLTIKGNNAFLIVDAHGDIPIAYPTELGFYHRDTRLLSGFEMTLNGSRPILLFSGLSKDSRSILVELTNTDFKIADKVIHRTSLYVKKEIQFLSDDVVLIEVNLKNLSRFVLPCDLAFSLQADFLDIFEVRGKVREKRGELLPPKVSDNEILFEYIGLDGKKRSVCVSVEPRPDSIGSAGFGFHERLSPREELKIEIRFRPHGAPRSSVTPCGWPFESNFSLSFSDDLYTRIFARSKQDIGVMASEIDGSKICMAGIPWYCAIFGRDALITAYELLPWLPDLARGTLEVLASRQAKDFDDFTDREPGKILHELREGEMAYTREVPFIPYYGSVDSTPLFLILAAEYVKITGNLKFLREIWDEIELAVEWLEKYGDLDGDGFLEYKTRSPLGLRNQGWKDSHDAIHHRNGDLAEPPIAVVEAQGYKYRALIAFSEMCRLLGKTKLARIYRRRAESFKKSFNKVFWMEDENFYCLALDAKKKQCRVITSNPGHCLFAGVVPKSRAVKVVKRLMGEEMFTGYGIRTLSKRELLYNPMSYHNGSVWAHDCAICVEGFVKYGFQREALKVFEAVMEAAAFFQDYRIAELYCGFEREEKGPVPYPVACSPQAWSSGSVFLMLKNLLGVEINAEEKILFFFYPVLPERVKELELRDWNISELGATFSLRFINNGGHVTVETLKKPRDWKVVLVVK